MASKPVGAPRTTTPPKEKVIELGEDLVKWSEEETDELRCRFCEWYTQPDIGMLRSEFDAMCKLDEFRVYYERARAALGKRYIDGSINPSMAHRFMWHMVPESADQEKAKFKAQEEARAEAEVKIAKEIAVTTINYAGSSKDRNNPPT